MVLHLFKLFHKDQMNPIDKLCPFEGNLL
jgi:hypothetical protein